MAIFQEIKTTGVLLLTLFALVRAARMVTPSAPLGCWVYIQTSPCICFKCDFFRQGMLLSNIRYGMSEISSQFIRDVNGHFHSVH